MTQQPSLQEPPKSHRFPELDSLRGLAAMAVLFSHFLRLYYPGRVTTLVLARFPFRILTEGHKAVVLFFLLSGFVLTLPYKNSGLKFKSYLVRRVCRIYLPYLAALLFALLALWRFHGPLHRGLPGDQWANLTWTESPRLKLILQHVVVLGDYDWSQYNTAFWSLIYEMRISLFFPFVGIAVLRLPSWISLLTSVVLSVIVRPLAVLCSPLIYVDLSHDIFLGSKLFLTFHFLSFFILGSVLAKNLHRIRPLWNQIPIILRAVSLVIALELYDGSLLSHLPRLSRFLGSRLLPDQAGDWITAMGAFLLIALAIHMVSFRRLLHHRIVNHLGRVSYSLYLVHGTILFIFVRLLPAPRGFWLPFLVYGSITLLITEAFYRSVEIPAMNLGRFLVPGKARPDKVVIHV